VNDGRILISEQDGNGMGDQQVSPLSRDSKSAFLRHLIQDIEALDRLVAEGKIEQDVTRIGAEQEYCW
jgi:hypothetical protein